jgi:hypothetical protein
MTVEDGEMMRWDNGMTLSLGEVIAAVRADRDGVRRGIKEAVCDEEYLTIIWSGSVYEDSNQINLKFGSLARDPRLEPLFESRKISNPKTDGERVFWDGGPSLSEDEIFELLLRH